jgi:hypothetical protein
MPGSPLVAPATTCSEVPQRHLGVSTAIALISALVLFYSVIWTLVLGFVWALRGILDLGLIATVLAAALVAPPALLACWRLTRMAVAGERALLASDTEADEPLA